MDPVEARRLLRARANKTPKVGAPLERVLWRGEKGALVLDITSASTRLLVAEGASTAEAEAECQAARERLARPADG